MQGWAFRLLGGGAFSGGSQGLVQILRERKREADRRDAGKDRDREKPTEGCPVRPDPDCRRRVVPAPSMASPGTRLPLGGERPPPGCLSGY